MELIGEDNKKPYQYMIFLVAISAIKYEWQYWEWLELLLEVCQRKLLKKIALEWNLKVEKTGVEEIQESSIMTGIREWMVQNEVGGIDKTQITRA
jgi:hypothetical protein